MEIEKCFPKSKVIHGIEWLSRRIGYPEAEIKGDTYPVTWAEDDAIYTSAGDPNWGETFDGLDTERITGMPENWKIEKTNPMNDYRGWGGNGPKPTGMICVDGILYMAVQNLLGAQRPPFSVASQNGTDAQIVYSFNKGGFWTPSLQSIHTPMFPGYKFGGPAFINHGKNNEYAKDDYVYAVSSDQWDNGSNLRLGRVHKTKIMEAGCWEWVAAFDLKHQPVWTNDLEAAIPVLSMYKWLGAPEMVYHHTLDRYILFTWRLHGDFSPDSGTDLIVMESKYPWGPFSLVYAEEYWEGKAFTPYCPRLPLKWLSDDGITGWLLFSGSWGENGQRELYYRANIRKFKFVV